MQWPSKTALNKSGVETNHLTSFEVDLNKRKNKIMCYDDSKTMGKVPFTGAKTILHSFSYNLIIYKWIIYFFHTIPYIYTYIYIKKYVNQILPLVPLFLWYPCCLFPASTNQILLLNKAKEAAKNNEASSRKFSV